MNIGNTLILGDSYSTFKGYIPSGYSIYYSPERVNEPRVPTVEETWWYPLIEECGGTLIENNSWSGSTVCHTGYNGADTSGTSSFVHRLDTLRDSGFFLKDKIDTVLIFGGTNDSWARVSVGDFIYSDWTPESLYYFRPALAYIISSLREFVPSARLLVIANSNISNAISDSIATVAEHYNVPHLALQDIDKISGHPTVLGMAQIRSQVYSALEAIADK